MAMAMGVASLAVTTTAAPKHALVTPRAAANKGENRGEKQGFLDWFRSALDKESLSETDAVLAKQIEDGKSSNGKSSDGKALGANKKEVLPLPPIKKVGFNFFGKK